MQVSKCSCSFIQSGPPDLARFPPFWQPAACARLLTAFLASLRYGILILSWSGNGGPTTIESLRSVGINIWTASPRQACPSKAYFALGAGWGYPGQPRPVTSKSWLSRMFLPLCYDDEPNMLSQISSFGQKQRRSSASSHDTHTELDDKTLKVGMSPMQATLLALSGAGHGRPSRLPLLQWT